MRVGATRDLASDVSDFRKEAIGGGAESSSSTTRGAHHHVRALSFSYPQRSVMEDFAETWRSKVREAISSSEMTTAAVAAAETTIVAVGEEFDDDDEEDMNDEENMDDEDMDDDDLDDYLQMMSASRAAVSSSPSPPLFVDGTVSSGVASAVAANVAVGRGGATTTTAATTTTTTIGEDTIVSPFERAAEIKVDHRDYESTSEYDDATKKQSSATTLDSGSPLELTVENVDAVLDEVRPYLISDGGNVSVRGVGEGEDGDGKETPSGGRKNVYLVLEGACGSCASSTVTMKMGIERVLREKFGDALGGVVQVDPASEDGGDGGRATCLTMEAVRAEVDRMSQAIVAMGGVVRISKVDPEFGVVTIDYRGPNRVRRGLELALLDVEYVRHVEFVSS